MVPATLPTEQDPEFLDWLAIDYRVGGDFYAKTMENFDEALKFMMKDDVAAEFRRWVLGDCQTPWLLDGCGV